MIIKVKAFAKINLMLDILSRLDNGYHDLFMIMQSVGIYDTVTVEKNSNGSILITCDVPDIPTNMSFGFSDGAEFINISKVAGT